MAKDGVFVHNEEDCCITSCGCELWVFNYSKYKPTITLDLGKVRSMQPYALSGGVDMLVSSVNHVAGDAVAVSNRDLHVIGGMWDLQSHLI